jgi:hypothetical protein
MARNTRLIPYDEPYDQQQPQESHQESYDEPYDRQIVGHFDDHPSDSEFEAYESAPLMATERYAFPEDRMPIFLSNDVEEPRPRGFGSGGDFGRNGMAVWPRILKGGIFVASAAAIAFALLSVENPLALFANAKAALIGPPPVQSGATQPSTPQPAGGVQLASTGLPAPVMASTSGARPSPPAARATPTRDDIALALKAAQQNQAEAVQPPAAAAPVRKLDADELAVLLKRARGLIAIGDIASGRLLLERAADAQEADAALLLAQTYDPVVLGTQDMRSITPDPAMARDWYRKAARFGSTDARQRLAQMQN